MDFCPDTRPGKDAEEMTETLIYNWNSLVKGGDIVYHLGDVSFGTKEQTFKALQRLHGEIHLILGNHDSNNLMFESKRFAYIHKYFERRIDGQLVCMFHYPIHEWNQMHRGSIHLFGHVHGRAVARGKSMDVGIDTRKNGSLVLSPYHWDEIVDLMKDKPVLERDPSSGPLLKPKEN